MSFFGIAKNLMSRSKIHYGVSTVRNALRNKLLQQRLFPRISFTIPIVFGIVAVPKIRDHGYCNNVIEDELKVPASNQIAPKIRDITGKVSINYKEGALHGKYEKYNSEGILIETCTFVDGIINWYDLIRYRLHVSVSGREISNGTGHITGKVVAHFREGVLHGKYERYNERGILIETCTFVNGVIIGLHAMYNDNDHNHDGFEKIICEWTEPGTGKCTHFGNYEYITCEIDKGVTRLCTRYFT